MFGKRPQERVHCNWIGVVEAFLQSPVAYLENPGKHAHLRRDRDVVIVAVLTDEEMQIRKVKNPYQRLAHRSTD
jgi:hypothetical protein